MYDHEEIVRARGHENVSAAHQSTFEVTTDDWLTPAGDCILAVAADRAPASFDSAFVAACQTTDAEIEATVTVGGREWPATGRGDPQLTFDSDRSLVCRTSTYIDDRTVMVEASGAAMDLDRAVVTALTEGAELTLTLRVG
ncbi:MAG: uncharacterized protein conserved in archaea [halophilic archaeon J07HB67]|nr:MAG: uncharacterized protein conserved in archaea [halophilic archaeon J07HB67]